MIEHSFSPELLSSKERKPLVRMRTIKEAAGECGIAAHFVRQLVLENKVPCVKAGRKYLVNLDKLVEYLEHGEVI